MPSTRFGTLAVGTVLLALLTHICFASTPLPLGGPNIAMAFLAASLAVIALAAASPRTALAHVREQLTPILPVLAAAVSMLLWALAVYSATDTLDANRLAKMALGIGVLFAVFVCVSNARRACAMVFVFVLATTVSALFGMAVVRVGDPFLGMWLQVTNVAQEDLQDMVLYGRNAGLAAHIATFGQQLAVAIPLALAALLYANYGVRSWHQHCVGAVFFVLLMTLVTAMLLNATRSVLVSVCLVSAIVAVPALGSVRARRRLLLATPFATVWLLLYFNPVVATDSEAGAAAPAAITGDVQELAASDAPLYGDDLDMVGHMFVGQRRDTRYEVELRERYLAGFGQPSVLTVQADGNGAFVLSWRKRHDIVHYQYRLRPVGEANWPMWVNFLPSLGKGGKDIRYDPVSLEGVVVGHAWPNGPLDRHRLRHHVYDARPGERYSVQLLPLDLSGAPIISYVDGTADEDGVIVLTWLAPSAPGISGYRYRVREQHGPWRDWHTIPTPNRMIASPEDTLPGLRTGGESFAGEDGMALVGHAFGGFVPWIWYVVQVRQARKAGVSRLGEVTAKPDQGGSFILAWQAPEAPKDVVGHAFRARNIADAEWSPWQDFVPSMANHVPALEPVPWPNERGETSSADAAERTRRHTLEGLSSGLEYRAQIRARTNDLFGVESAEITFSAGRDGTWTFAWREPTVGIITGYQFRLWWLLKDTWRPWQDFVPAEDGSGRTTPQFVGTLRSQEENVQAARAAHNLGHMTAQTKGRFADILGGSTRSRFHQIRTSLRYIGTHPLGTGIYAPSRVHVGEGLEEWMVEELLRLWPHNQFLHVGVLFGLPGIAILVAFYACTLRPAIRCGVFARRGPDTSFRFLAIGVVGAWAAYSINSLFVPTGPFVNGWSHFYLIGLLFAVERIIRAADSGGSAIVSSKTP